MTGNYQLKLIETAKAFFDRNGWEYSESEKQNCKYFDLNFKQHKANVSIYTTGKLVPGGSDSPLKRALNQFKEAIENDGAVAEILPFEIETFPEKLKVNIPEIDPIIIRFLSEAITCYKANSLLGCSFLLGAASEKAIWQLIESFTKAIESEQTRAKFQQRTGGGRFVSRAYDEFRKSIESSSPKPEELMSQTDFATQVDSIFQFCRLCRNEVGHPQISPNLDPGVILANMGQFVKYMEAVHRLKKFYDTTRITL